ncbi:hypothetical protein [Mycolicibacillus koreensis]|uniref:hypothetical protein n=1 Tax=Mycolicibacillus koreensis TaxID=1069220 RepID=UPI001054C863|nr:hypothetical protein [Mycolicibacillus koreensis]BBY54199.1 hypothetical protein MKOR_14500 [Mycolicibacillus koreensis]
MFVGAYPDPAALARDVSARAAKYIGHRFSADRLAVEASGGFNTVDLNLVQPHVAVEVQRQ